MSHHDRSVPMPEHLIRLRGGWLRSDCEGGPETVHRVSLPLEGPPRGTSRVTLTRQFGRPPIDPSGERLALRLEEVVGLVELRLNGRPMPIPPAGATDLDLSSDDLRPTGNVLILEVLPLSGSPAGSNEPRWGRVALVIRRHDPPDVSGTGGGLLGDGPRGA